MNPSQLNLPTIWRGCLYDSIVLQWKDQNGNPFDLTGWTPSAMTRNGVNLNAVVTQAVNGFTRLSMTQVQTAPLKLGVDNWDWIWTYGGVTQQPSLSGSVEVKEPYTPTS